MSLIGAYEEGGLVVLEDDERPPVRLTWRQAMERCNAVAQAEQREKFRNRSAKIQSLIEQMVGASVAARKKSEPNWKPPASLLGFSIGKKSNRIIVPS